MSFSPSILLCFYNSPPIRCKFPSMFYSIMFLLKKYINNNFETINAEKQELNCLNFICDSQFACVQLPDELSRFNLAGNYTFFSQSRKNFTFGSVGNNITFLFHESFSWRCSLKKIFHTHPQVSHMMTLKTSRKTSSLV